VKGPEQSVQTSARSVVAWTADGVPAGAPLSAAEAEAVGAKYWFDREAADVACDFFPVFCVHLEGELAGQPFDLEQWQRDDIIRPAFGWKRLDGSRRYRILYIEIPRKNGKTTLAAGIALLLTFADKEAGAQVYSAASDKDQAAIVFDAAVAMRNANHELRRRSLAYKKALVVPTWGASFKPLSTVAKSKHGFNVHGFVFDEFHVQPDRELYDVLHTGTGARAQPLEVIITTAGSNKHSICWELHDHAIKVQQGALEDDAFLGVIYAADGEKDDWKDPATWRKANPNLGVSVKLDYIERECLKAQQITAYENTFKRLHLNIWTEQVSRWIPLETWDACGEVVAAADLEGMECTGGLDLSSVSDLSALLLDFKREDGAHIWLPFFWMPKENIDRRVKRDRVPYDVWVKQGLIKATEGNVVDYRVIRADMNDLAEHFVMREVAFDRWNAQSLVTDLQEDGFTMVAFGQGFASMSAPTKELEKLILGHLLVHSKHPVLRWMLSNVAVQQDPAGNNKPDKESSGEKIDGIVAGIMALARNMVIDKTPKPGFAEL
jgi:phage terminase large subunit-like protein